VKILAVDDEVQMRELLHEMLSRFGYECKTAANGREALSILQDDYFPIIVSDVIMPVMDGIELLKNTKKSYPDIDVISMTGYSKDYTFVDVIKAGASDFILKPFSSDELEAKINRIIREKELKEKERLMALFAELDPSPVLRFDRNGKILMANPSTVTSLPVSTQPLLGMSLTSIIPGIGSLDLTTCINNGTILSHSTYIENRFFHFLIKGVPDLGIGQIYGADITDRKLAEDELQKTKDYLENIIESSLDAIIVSDRKGYILKANRSFMNMLDYDKEVLMGKHLTEFSVNESGIYESITGELVNVDWGFFNQEGAIANNSLPEAEMISQWESYFIRKDKKIVPTELNISYLRNREGCITGSVAVIRNITERREKEKEIKEARDFLESVIENSKDGIVINDLNGYIISVNTALEKMSSYHKEELIGKHASIITIENKNIRKKILKKTEQLFEKGFVTYESKHMTKEGHIINVECSSSMIRDDKGNYTAGVTVIRDITDRKKAEEELKSYRYHLEELVEKRTAELINTNVQLKQEITERKQAEVALRKSEKRFRDLVENSLTGIFIIQNDKIIYQNPEQERLFGLLAKSFKFTDFKNIYKDDVEKVKQLYENIVTGKLKTIDLDFRICPNAENDSDTDMSWVNCRASTIDYQNKNAILVNMIDITRAKEMEHLLRIQGKMTSLGRVAAGIAHELRNPLSGINIYLTTLERAYDNLKGIEPGDLLMVKKIIDQLRSASDKIESVVRRVMDFAKPSTPKLISSEINLPVQEAINLSLATLRKEGISIETSLKPDLPQCYADPHLIEQVLLNLITNAAHAMTGIEDTKKLEISSFTKDNHVLISVSDAGPGIPVNLRDKIFDPFYTTKNTGSGIGLSLCHRIITDHGGSLDVTSSKWGGAEFSIAIPIEKRAKGR